MANSEPDFKRIFESSPRAYLILDTQFNIVAVNNVYLILTKTARSKILGKHIFDVFPDNPDDPDADGVKNLTSSLNQVIKTKQPHVMSLQKYDVRDPNSSTGAFEAKFWRPENWPVLNDVGEVVYLIHCAEEVTHLIDMLNAATDKQKELQNETE